MPILVVHTPVGSHFFATIFGAIRLEETITKISSPFLHDFYINIAHQREEQRHRIKEGGVEGFLPRRFHAILGNGIRRGTWSTEPALHHKRAC